MLDKVGRPIEGDENGKSKNLLGKKKSAPVGGFDKVSEKNAKR